jgi:hypothetical protein
VTQIGPNPSDISRLALCDRASVEGAVDGAWWPNNCDLRTELPDLIAVFGLWIGPVHRVIYDPSVWLPAPSRVIRGNKVISIDPYQLVAPDTIYLIGTHSRDAVLFVLPPTSADDAARRVLRAVTDFAQPMSVTMLRQLASQSAPLAQPTS